MEAAADGELTSAVSPHTLRTTFGSHLLNLGVRLEVVAELLGHANTRVTEEAYAELLKATVRREALAALMRRGLLGRVKPVLTTLR
jgi:site-specific recombinase XerD